MKDWNDLSDEEKEAFRERASEIVADAKEQIANGKMICLHCSKEVPLEQSGNQWTATCTCGWEAAGQGYIKPRFN